MPTFTTTVTETDEAGRTTTITTTESTPDPTVWDGQFNSWVIDAPADKVGPHIQFDTLLTLPGMDAAFESMEVTGSGPGEFRSIVMPGLEITEKCVGAGPEGHSYTIVNDVRDTHLKLDAYRGTFSVAPVSATQSVISWTVSYCTTDAEASKAALDGFLPLLSGAFAGLNDKLNGKGLNREEFLIALYPRSVDTVRTEWLSKLLEKEVVSHKLVKLLDAGVTSDAAIFGLEYAEGVEGPATICLKYAKGTESNRQFAMGGSMYKKELYFMKNMHSKVAEAMNIPSLIGVFADSEKPDEFFCIAMEDLNPTAVQIDQIAGATFAECQALSSLAVGLHAKFWNDPILKEDVVCQGNPDACSVFFEPWAMLGCTVEGAWENFHKLCLEEPISCDMSPTDADKEMIRLMKAHQPALFAEFHKILDARPAKTLTHGDMRGDNMFKKKDGSGFVVIDWQTFGAATPGVEMHQLFANQMDDLTEYKRLPELMKGYITELHAKCPASAAYTYDMLWEDFRICGSMGCLCMSIAFGGMMAELPKDHPNYILFSKFLPRCRETYNVLECADYVIKTCARLGLN